MADRKTEKDLLTRLSDVGEDALSRVAGSQATTRLLDTVGGMRERLEDVQKKVRGIDALEQRIAKLEKQVADLSKPKTRARTTTPRKTTTTPRRTTPKRPPPPST
jgi:uncharacterized protein involved in exopolysaccharide biosynthesis